MQIIVKTLSEELRARGLKMSAAESCTGGMISAAVTDLAGSSDIFDRGFVTYSNQAKMDMLGVSSSTLEQYGAVSEQTAAEMASGAIVHSLADCSVAVTGIAGPSGSSDDKPVGLVYIAVGRKGMTSLVTKNNFDGDRSSVREQATLTAIKNLLDLIKA